MEMESCDTSLGLGIGNRNLSFDRQQERQQRRRRQSPPVQFDLLFPHHMNGVDEERDGDGSSSKTVDDEDDKDKSVRKKLKLTKEQSSLLENIFKEYRTPSLTQKQELAKQLNLQPRQVEVWFQNRRARSKVKQTEVDFEFLKKCCERLSEENQRLKKELHELRSVDVGESQFLVQLPKAVSTTMIMCPAHCSLRREDSEIRIL